MFLDRSVKPSRLSFRRDRTRSSWGFALLLAATTTALAIDVLRDWPVGELATIPSPSLSSEDLPLAADGDRPSVESTPDSSAQPPNPQPSPVPRRGAIATLVNAKLANYGRDVPDLPATVSAQQIEFPDLAYPRSQQRQDEQLLILSVLVAPNGNPQLIAVYPEHLSPSYSDLARQVLENWEFQPAEMGDRPVASLLDLYLKLDPL